MAYGIHFGATPFSQISAFQSGALSQLSPARVAVGSHISPGYIEHLRLRDLLIEAFDGGVVLRSDLWHPCRAPLFHGVERVSVLAPAIEASFAELITDLDDRMKEAYRSELGDV